MEKKKTKNRHSAAGDVASLLKNVAKQDWTEVWNDLCFSPLDQESEVIKLSAKLKLELRNALVIIRQAIDNKAVDLDLVSEISKSVEKISQILNKE